MSKSKGTVYWVITSLLSLAMISGGLGQIIQPEWNQENLNHLGYPMYFFYVIGTWKILGAIAILLPRMPFIKEWAYAGLFFVMTGAFITHIAIGDPVSKMISSLVFTFFIVISWYLRPYSRKIASSRS